MVTWLNACVKVQQLWLPAFSGLWNTYCINIYIYIHIYSYTVNRPLSRCCYVTQTKDGKVFRINIANLQIKWKRKKEKKPNTSINLSNHDAWADWSYKSFGPNGLSPPTFTEHDRSWLSELKKLKAEETEQGRESDWRPFQTWPLFSLISRSLNLFHVHLIAADAFLFKSYDDNQTD